MQWWYRFILSTVFTMATLTTHCQDTNNGNYGRFASKFTPTSLANIDYPSFDFSLEYLKSEKLSYELTIGYSGLSYYLGVGDTQFVPNRVFKASFEIKYYSLFSNKEPTYYRNYISLQPFFQYRQFNNYAEFGDTTLPGGKVNTDNFSETESVYGINLKIGREVASRHLIFDYWAGVGIKYRYAHAGSLNSNPNHFLSAYVPPDPNIPTMSYENSLALLKQPGLTFNLPLGFKIGYIF